MSESEKGLLVTADTKESDKVYLSESKVNAAVAYLTERLLRRPHEEYANSDGSVSIPIDADHAYGDTIKKLLALEPYHWQDVFNRNYMAELSDSIVTVRFARKTIS